MSAGFLIKQDYFSQIYLQPFSGYLADIHRLTQASLLKLSSIFLNLFCCMLTGMDYISYFYLLRIKTLSIFVCMSILGAPSLWSGGA